MSRAKYRVKRSASGRTWDVVNGSGRIVEGGFFARDRAEDVARDMNEGRDPDYGTRGNPPVRRIGDSVNDYASAARFLGSKDGVKLAHNTFIQRHGRDEIVVIFHSTIIVRYFADGQIELNTNGYHTVTTKQRLNQLLPPWLDVVQRKGDWIVENRLTGERIPFRDRMRVSGEVPEVRRDNPGGKFSNAVIEAIYNAMNAGEVSVVEAWDDGNGGEWMALVNTDTETAERNADDPDEFNRMLSHRNRFPVLRDGVLIAFLSGDSQGFVSGELFDGYRQSEDYWAREMDNLAYEDELDEDDE